MPLFVPILRMFMLFLNVWDTYKTLKPPPIRVRNGKAEPPTVRSVTQRKRDLKGCLAVWIVWCCFSIYERHVEPIMSLFIPFYSEFKALVILFLIFTRARGAEPIFLHLLRPFLRPYTKSIDSSLEIFRLVGDILVTIVSFPLIAFFGFKRFPDDVPPPYSEAPIPEERRTPSPFTTHLSNGHVSSFYPTDPAADMEWRKYPNIPSAYPPTPLVNSSRLPNPRPASGHVGYDPGPAAGGYTIWVPPVAEEDEENPDETRQDFHRSLLPPRVPLHPGLGYHDGLSDESERGAKKQIPISADIRRDDSASSRSSGAEEEETDEMEVDSEVNDDNRQYDSDQDDSDEDSFNMTLQTPRVPLSLRPSSTTASRSTIRLRASARSVFNEIEKENEGKKRLSLSGSGSGSAPPLPAPVAEANSGNYQDSSPSSIDSESVSISSEDDASMLLPHPNIGSAIAPAVTSLAPLSTGENDDVTSDSSLGSAPGVHHSLPLRFISPEGRGQKRSHSHSFPLEQITPKGKEKPDVAGPSLQRLSSEESTSSSLSPSDASDVEQEEPEADLALPAAVTEQTRSLRSAGRTVGSTSSIGGGRGGGGRDEGEVRAEEVLLSGTRKRRKVISTASGKGAPSTASESDSVGLGGGSRVSSRRRPLAASTLDKGKAKAAGDGAGAGASVGAALATRTRTSTRPRRQQPVSGLTPDAEKSGSVKFGAKATSTAKGKGKASSSKSTSTVPSRKRFDVTSKSTGTGTTMSMTVDSLRSKGSTSTLRTTRSTAGLPSTRGGASDGRTNVEGSDGDDDEGTAAVASDAVESGLEADDDYPLHVARARTKRMQV